MAHISLVIRYEDPDLLNATINEYARELAEAVRCCADCGDEPCAVHYAQYVESFKNAAALALGMAHFSEIKSGRI